MAASSLRTITTLLTATFAGILSAEDLTYDRDVRPILKAHCFQCHGEEGAPKGGLDLRLRRLLVSGGESGPALHPGRPDQDPFPRARVKQLRELVAAKPARAERAAARRG